METKAVPQKVRQAVVTVKVRGKLVTVKVH